MVVVLWWNLIVGLQRFLGSNGEDEFEAID